MGGVPEAHVKRPDNVVEDVGSGTLTGSKDIAEEPERWPEGHVMDLTQFSQWMAKHQVQLLRDVTQQQQAAQAAMMRLAEGPSCCQTSTRRWQWGIAADQRTRPLLTKLGQEDEIEAFLEAFVCTAEVAQWLVDQWAFILGYYLTKEAQAS
ncbi:UNVERIFIED_CONTAM: hypothetical protein K2H54_074532 [Gekko kuhli]